MSKRDLYAIDYFSNYDQFVSSQYHVDEWKVVCFISVSENPLSEIFKFGLTKNICSFLEY